MTEVTVPPDVHRITFEPGGSTFAFSRPLLVELFNRPTDFSDVVDIDAQLVEIVNVAGRLVLTLRTEHRIAPEPPTLEQVVARLAYAAKLDPAEARAMIEQAQTGPLAGKTIAVDLDGTLALYTEWNGRASIGEPLPQALDAMWELYLQGARLLVHTCRCSDFVAAQFPPDPLSIRESAQVIADWAAEHDFPPLEVYIGHGKPYAEHYIDDRGLRVEPQVSPDAWGRAIEIILGGRCRVCGCTEARACDEGCWWVEPNLCSACVDPRSELELGSAITSPDPFDGWEKINVKQLDDGGYIRGDGPGPSLLRSPVLTIPEGALRFSAVVDWQVLPPSLGVRFAEDEAQLETAVLKVPRNSLHDIPIPPGAKVARVEIMLDIDTPPQEEPQQ